MMAPIWLVCCARTVGTDVRAEIAARCPSAQVVRFGDVTTLGVLAESLADSLGGVVVCVDGVTDEVEAAIASFAEDRKDVALLAFVERVDAGIVARLFHAGATEVIAAGGSPVGEQRDDGVCLEEGRRPEYSPGPPARDEDLEKPPWNGVAEPVRSPETTGAIAVTRERAEDLLAERSACERFWGPSEDDGRPRSPLVVAISGRGGCGKSTIVAAMAWWAAHMGLKAAVVDLDLMFGNLCDVMGVERVCDLAGLVDAKGKPACTQEAIEATAMKIAPGLTLWGPCSLPEQAELLSLPSEQLIEALRREADVIFADTSVFWGDAAASAVSRCDRCLVVGSGGVSGGDSASRAVSLASRIGVPKTRMTSVFNRFGAPGCGEEQAMRFEMAVALRSRVRIADGGSFVGDLLSFGRLGDLMVVPGAFARDVQACTYDLLKELGCPLEAWDEQQRVQNQGDPHRPRIKLPWHKLEGGGR